ncbi:hypothetical protein TrCOL_g7463 [Triparma columacea]|uniref:Uncharacterized protein n=1 Tax=Triparma columacea TaxID=722753 RepID=A0A9W7G4L2_9STRA|nr:hypothetical protein TrCOL_g7463 [Triparma columacea]
MLISLPITSARASSTLPPVSENKVSNIIPQTSSSSSESNTFTEGQSGWYSVGLRDYQGVIPGNQAGHWVVIEVNCGDDDMIKGLGLTFQGGFVGTGGGVDVEGGELGEWSEIEDFEDADDWEYEFREDVRGGKEEGWIGRDEWDDFNDCNLEQVVMFEGDGGRGKRRLRLRWGNSTDIYGRVIVYRVRAFGVKG